MKKHEIQANTDSFVLIGVRKRIHFLLSSITEQSKTFNINKAVVKFYSNAATALKKPFGKLSQKELLLNDKKQVEMLYKLYASPDFNPIAHMNVDKKDISGHFVFSLNVDVFDNILDSSFDQVNYWGTNTSMNVKKQIIAIMLLLDSLFLTAFYEFGRVGLTAVLNGQLANTGQWWAWMELNDFSSSSYKHAGNLLIQNKNSKLAASINGASALFPSNITYARFSEFLAHSHDEFASYNALINKFKHSDENDFNLVITKRNLAQFSVILAEFRFHAVALYTGRMHMFANTYVGYVNMWRYNNIALRKLE